MSEAAWKIGSKNHKISQAIVGFILGVPFFIGVLLRQFSGRPLSFHQFSVVALIYLLFFVLPCSTGLGVAFSTFGAPDGEEKHFAQATFFCYAMEISILFVLAVAWIIYGKTTPHLLHRGSGFFTLPRIVFATVANLLALAVAAQMSYALGLKARNDNNNLARFLQRCGYSA